MQPGSFPPLGLEIADHAWFFDVDGTLVELAPTPSSVRVTLEDRWRIRQFARAAKGAFALVSGRSIDVLDGILGLHDIPLAGEHGLQRRDANGKRTQVNVDSTFLRHAVSALRPLAMRTNGLLLEEKCTGVALHYRLNPAAADMAVVAVQRLAVASAGGFFALHGKCVIELRAAGADKGMAIAHFMQAPPFTGRRPIMVGDDTTDEAAFTTVLARGGYAVKVGAGRSVAPFRLPDTASVHRWMDALLDHAGHMVRQG
jgi:trehalose 6-phosphate phosphatase